MSCVAVRCCAVHSAYQHNMYGSGYIIFSYSIDPFPHNARENVVNSLVLIGIGWARALLVAHIRFLSSTSSKMAGGAPDEMKENEVSVKRMYYPTFSSIMPFNLHNIRVKWMHVWVEREKKTLPLLLYVSQTTTTNHWYFHRRRVMAAI